MENIVNEINFGTHKMINVFFDSFKTIKLFIILFIISFFITKKISKKAFAFNNILYIILTIFYLIISIIKAFALSNLPPHNLEKDLCGIKYSVIQIIISYHIPIIYTIILFAKIIDKKIKAKKEKNKQV